MANKHREDFKQEAVRIALTSGLPRRHVASDLGVGFSTLRKWVSQYRPAICRSPHRRIWPRRMSSLEKAVGAT